MSSRKIKEEMLEIVAPEIYGRRRRGVKIETKIKSEPLKQEIKSRRKRKRAGMDSLDEVEVVGVTAKRRPYQWKGRRVRRVLRPGTAVVFSPGVRTHQRGFKRQADEMYADDDILDQYAAGEGEFRYGKKAREETAVVLDTSNPTPSLQPVTPQLPVVTPRQAAKRGASAVTTVQVLAPKKRRIDQVATDDVFMRPTVVPENLTEMSEVPPGTAFLLPARAVARPRRRRVPAVTNMDSIMIVDEGPKPPEPMIVEEVKVRDVKPVAPGIGVQTIDVKVPVKKPEMVDIGVETDRTPYHNIRLHPSQLGIPKSSRVWRTTRRRRRRVRSRSAYVPLPPQAPPTRPRRLPRSRILLPAVRYHPSIRSDPRTETAIWR